MVQAIFTGYALLVMTTLSVTIGILHKNKKAG
jgi:hypothetical protein